VKRGQANCREDCLKSKLQKSSLSISIRGKGSLECSSFHYFDDYFRVSFAFDPSPDLPHVIKPTKLLIIDGNSLEPIDLVRCERGECAIQVNPFIPDPAEIRNLKCSCRWRQRSECGRADCFSRKSLPIIKVSSSLHCRSSIERFQAVYGVTTGFGTFSNVRISPENIKLGF